VNAQIVQFLKVYSSPILHNTVEPSALAYLVNLATSALLTLPFITTEQLVGTALVVEQLVLLVLHLRSTTARL
jgi:hypothetical protein